MFRHSAELHHYWGRDLNYWGRDLTPRLAPIERRAINPRCSDRSVPGGPDPNR
jgi:hypothetical protein